MTQVEKNNEFMRKVIKLRGNTIVNITDYRGANESVRMKCNNCRYEWDVKYARAMYDKRYGTSYNCPRCAGMERTAEGYITLEEVKRRLIKEHNGTVELIGCYTGIKDYSDFRCAICGNTWKALVRLVAPPSEKSHRSGCPVCSESHGEKLIASILHNNKVEYKREVRFEELRHSGSYMPFDFGVYKYNKLKYLIEFDGIQHYKPIELFGGQERLRLVQKNDREKTDFCAKNNIDLIRIPYYLSDTEVNTLLKEIIKV